MYVSWGRLSETCSVPSHKLFQCREPRRQDREHSRSVTKHPSPKRDALSRLTCTPIFSLVHRFSKYLFSKRMYQVASTGIIPCTALEISSQQLASVGRLMNGDIPSV